MEESPLELELEWLELLHNFDDSILVSHYQRILRACGDARSLPAVRRVHAHILASGKAARKSRLLENLLVDAYGKCRNLEEARRVFDAIARRNEYSWDSMMRAHISNADHLGAMLRFRSMLLEGDPRPNKVTLLAACEACISSAAAATMLHSIATESGMIQDVSLATAMLGVLGKCRCIDAAAALFDQMQHRDTVAWNVMIAADAQNGHCTRALRSLRLMDLEGIAPTGTTFVAVLDAIAGLKDGSRGRGIHARMASMFRVESSVILATAILNMYSKCGCIDEARNMFDRMKDRNVIAWTAMLAAYVKHGNAAAALGMHLAMELEGLLPNEVTFSSILLACANAGLVEEAKLRFLVMTEAHGIPPRVEHLRCLVDAMSKAGKLQEAKQLSLSMTKLRPFRTAARNVCTFQCRQYKYRTVSTPRLAG